MDKQPALPVANSRNSAIPLETPSPAVAPPPPPPVGSARAVLSPWSQRTQDTVVASEGRQISPTRRLHLGVATANTPTSLLHSTSGMANDVLGLSPLAPPNPPPQHSGSAKTIDLLVVMQQQQQQQQQHKRQRKGENDDDEENSRHPRSSDTLAIAPPRRNNNGSGGAAAFSSSGVNVVRPLRFVERGAPPIAGGARTSDDVSSHTTASSMTPTEPSVRLRWLASCPLATSSSGGSSELGGGSASRAHSRCGVLGGESEAATIASCKSMSAVCSELARRYAQSAVEQLFSDSDSHSSHGTSAATSSSSHGNTITSASSSSKAAGVAATNTSLPTVSAFLMGHCSSDGAALLDECVASLSQRVAAEGAQRRKSEQDRCGDVTRSAAPYQAVIVEKEVKSASIDLQPTLVWGSVEEDAAFSGNGGSLEKSPADSTLGGHAGATALGALDSLFIAGSSSLADDGVLEERTCSEHTRGMLLWLIHLIFKKHTARKRQKLASVQARAGISPDDDPYDDGNGAALGQGMHLHVPPAALLDQGEDEEQLFLAVAYVKAGESAATAPLHCLLTTTAVTAWGGKMEVRDAGGGLVSVRVETEAACLSWLRVAFCQLHKLSSSASAASTAISGYHLCITVDRYVGNRKTREGRYIPVTSLRLLDMHSECLQQPPQSAGRGDGKIMDNSSSSSRNGDYNTFKRNAEVTSFVEELWKLLASGTIVRHNCSALVRHVVGGAQSDTKNCASITVVMESLCHALPTRTNVLSPSSNSLPMNAQREGNITLEESGVLRRLITYLTTPPPVPPLPVQLVPSTVRPAHGKASTWPASAAATTPRTMARRGGEKDIQQTLENPQKEGRTTPKHAGDSSVSSSSHDGSNYRATNLYSGNSPTKARGPPVIASTLRTLPPSATRFSARENNTPTTITAAAATTATTTEAATTPRYVKNIFRTSTPCSTRAEGPKQQQGEQKKPLQVTRAASLGPRPVYRPAYTSGSDTGGSTSARAIQQQQQRSASATALLAACHAQESRRGSGGGVSPGGMKDKDNSNRMNSAIASPRRTSQLTTPPPLVPQREDTAVPASHTAAAKPVEPSVETRKNVRSPSPRRPLVHVNEPLRPHSLKIAFGATSSAAAAASGDGGGGGGGDGGGRPSSAFRSLKKDHSHLSSSGAGKRDRTLASPINSPRATTGARGRGTPAARNEKEDVALEEEEEEGEGAIRQHQPFRGQLQQRACSRCKVSSVLRTRRGSHYERHVEQMRAMEKRLDIIDAERRRMQISGQTSAQKRHQTPQYPPLQREPQAQRASGGIRTRSAGIWQRPRPMYSSRPEWV